MPYSTIYFFDNNYPSEAAYLVRKTGFIPKSDLTKKVTSGYYIIWVKSGIDLKTTDPIKKIRSTH